MTDMPQRLPLPTVPEPGGPLSGPDAETGATPVEAGLGRGLRFLHVWTSRTREDAWKAMLGVHTLMELLVAKGLITPEELEAQGAATAPRVQEAFAADPLAPVLGEVEDKYTVASPDIDCAARFHLCRARCCTLRFALSAQDLDEGGVRWEYARPYLIAQRSDGFCTHCHPATGACGVYQHRPAPCRSYDCRTDDRIWLNFEARIPADYAARDAMRQERLANERAMIRRASQGDGGDR
ncbi:MAG: YkgJ family cysteine cluster protein [Chloroflexi bacterium]|nr:YkgJ family cysteine cluster protein [Chloroflexota bacterium]